MWSRPGTGGSGHALPERCAYFDIVCRPRPIKLRCDMSREASFRAKRGDVNASYVFSCLSPDSQKFSFSAQIEELRRPRGNISVLLQSIR